MNRKSLGLILVGLAFLGLILVRFSRINADPPLSFSNGLRSYETFTDEAAKAYQARNRALFGKWNLSDQDQYRFWKVLSPVWCYPLLIWLKIFKVSYLSLRSFSIFWFALGLCFIGIAFRRGRLKKSALFAGLFYGFNFYLFIYSRLGLMETMLNSFLILSVGLLALSAKRKWLFPLSLLIFFMSYFLKQNALLLFPVFLAGFFPAFGSPFRERFWKTPAVWVSLALGLVFLGLLYHLWRQPDYRLFTVMNFRHGYGFPPDRSRMWLVVRPDFIREAVLYHFSPAGIWQTLFAFDPVVAGLGIMEILFILYYLVRRRSLENLELLALIWFLSLRIFLAASSARVERFWMPELPAMIFLAGLGLARVSEFLERKNLRRGRPALIGLILVLSFGYNFQAWLKWFSAPEYQMVEQGKKLEQALGTRQAVVIGKWAGPLLFPGRHQYYYVKNIFNRSPEQIESFGVTHLLLGEVPRLVRDQAELENDPYPISFKAAFPDRFQNRKTILNLQFYEGDLELDQVK